MLAYTLGKSEKTDYPFLNKAIEAQSSTGYIIQKKYYPILINTFQKCVDNMTTEKTTGVNWEQWALDQVWKENQKQDRKEYMKEYRTKKNEKIKEYNKNYRDNKILNEETII